MQMPNFSVFKTSNKIRKFVANEFRPGWHYISCMTDAHQRWMLIGSRSTSGCSKTFVLKELNDQ